MSDIYLKPTSSGEDIIVNAGQPQMTGGLDNAIYMSLFTADFWGNDLADPDSVYDSGIPAIIGAGVLSNKTRLDIIAEAQRVTAWMVTAGIVESFEITAEIPTVGTLYLSVKSNEPQRTEEFKYGINWDTQKVTVEENLW